VKTCSKCGIDKHETKFCKMASSRDGLQGWCKECSNVYQKSRYIPRPRRVRYVASPDSTKTCIRCGLEKRRDEFYKDAQRLDGFSNVCRACLKAYREVNREKINAQSRASRRKHVDKARASSDRWKQNNPEKCRAISRRRALKVSAQRKLIREAKRAALLNSTTKICIRCKKEKPKTEFSRNAARVDGFFSRCKACDAIYASTHYAAKPRNRTPDMTGVKVCARCKEEKPRTEFSRDATMNDGLNRICKVCTLEKSKKYRAPKRTCPKCGEAKYLNRFSDEDGNEGGQASWCKECKREAVKQQREADKQRARRPVNEKRCSRCGQVKPAAEFWKKKGTSDGLRAMCKACLAKARKHWKPVSPEKRRESTKRYRKTHPREAFAGKRNLRAKKAGAPGRLTHENIHALWFNSGEISRCWCCLASVNVGKYTTVRRVTVAEIEGVPLVPVWEWTENAKLGKVVAVVAAFPTVVRGRSIMSTLPKVEAAAPRPLHVDHAIPLAFRGIAIHDPAATNLLCAECNDLKNDHFASFHADSVYGINPMDALREALWRGFQLRKDMMKKVKLLRDFSERLQEAA
jgi:hypothetical protein